MTTLTQARPQLSSSSVRLLRDPILVLVGLLVLLATGLMLAQILVLIWTSLRPTTRLQTAELTLANFISILQQPGFHEVFGNTLALGIGSVAVMLAFALPFTWLYTRTNLAHKNLLLTLLTVKIAVPGFLVAMGYIYLLNPSNGIANRLAMDLLGLPSPPFNVYTLAWMAFLQGTALVSPAFFMLTPTFRAIDASLEEVAHTSGVRPLTTLRRIVVPLATPAIIATSIYYFIIAIESFDYAAMLGLPVRIFVFSTWIYRLVYPPFDEPRYGEAAALGILMSLAAIVLTLLYLWSIRQSDRFTVVTGKRSQQRPSRMSRRGQLLAWATISIYAALTLLLPLLLLVWSSLVPYLQVPSAAALADLTLDAYATALYEGIPILANTLAVTILVPTLSVIWAACLAWVMVRTRIPGRRLLDVLVMLAVAIPSIVGALAFLYLGLAVHQVIPLYTTIWLIVLAMSTRYITWANRTIANALLQVHREVEEACAVSGIRRGQAMLLVLMPTVSPALLFSWFWLALLALRELTIPVMLVRPNTQVLATAIWGFNAAGSSNVASAMGVILVTIIGVLVLLFHRLSGEPNI